MGEKAFRPELVCKVYVMSVACIFLSYRTELIRLAKLRPYHL